MYLQRVYLQIYLANNIAEINYMWRMSRMNDKIMIIIYLNPIRAYSDHFSKSHEWHNAKLTACWKHKLILVSFHENWHYLYCWRIASIPCNIIINELARGILNNMPCIIAHDAPISRIIWTWSIIHLDMSWKQLICKLWAFKWHMDDQISTAEFLCYWHMNDLFHDMDMRLQDINIPE